jgi:hypothetical protein
MSDALYLSLWYPNLRLETLGDKLVTVLESFRNHGGQPGVYSATVWPVDWNETPVFQHIWGYGERGAEPRAAVETALEMLHEDFAYEFQMAWDLWELELAEGLNPRWARAPRLVRVTAFGPLFSQGCYEQEGHLRIDFGPDAPFLEEEADLGTVGAKQIEDNVRQLIALTQAADKNSGATARLLWSELGESLAARLAARLGLEN